MLNSGNWLTPERCRICDVEIERFKRIPDAVYHVRRRYRLLLCEKHLKQYRDGTLYNGGK